MIVVSDSSPFIALINVGHLDILPSLFGQVIIPPAVAADLRKAFHAALARGLTAAGTVRVLIRAAQRKLLNLEHAFERLKRTDFWIDHKLLDRELDLFKREQSKNNSG